MTLTVVLDSANGDSPAGIDPAAGVVVAARSLVLLEGARS
jgi:hypothetical protein